MASPIPSEDEIWKMLEKRVFCDPFHFQVFIERFLMLSEGKRCAQLRPIGRNGETTTKGYADIAEILCDDKIIVSEVTKDKNWRNHLLKDIEKLKKLKGKVAAFSFFCASRSESLIPQENASKDRLEQTEEYFKNEINGACDVPRENVRIVFGDQLAVEIRRPRYLALLSEYDVSVVAAPFISIADVIDKNKTLMPSIKHFLDRHLVWRPAILAPLLRQLEYSRIAVVQGVGASGKTSLAVLAATEFGADFGNVYYLDISEAQDSTNFAVLAATVVTATASKNTLYILDNAHSNPSVMSHILSTWRQTGNESAVLILARAVDTELPHGVPKIAQFDMKPGIEDLKAISRFIIYEFFGEVLSPTPEALETWAPFVGDLIAFSFALRRKIRTSEVGEWHLSPEDAADYMKEAYWKLFSAEERGIVTKIALLARYEMPVSGQSLQQKKPNQAIAMGLVQRYSTGSGRFRLRLTHHRLGELILSCADRLDKNELLQEIVGLDTFQACYIARQLMNSDPETSRSILEGVSGRVFAFPAEFGPGYVGPISSLYIGLGVLTREQIEDRLIVNIGRLVGKHYEDPYVGLPHFIMESADKMPRLHNEALNRLSEQGAIDHLLGTMTSSAPQSVAEFLATISRHLPELFDKLETKFLSKAVFPVITARVAQGSLDKADRFYRACMRCEGRINAEAEKMVKRGNFSDHLLEKMLSEPFSVLMANHANAPLVKALLKRLDTEKWLSRNWRAEPGMVEAIRLFIPLCSTAGRMDLAEATAQKVLENSLPGDWPNSKALLSALIAILKAAGKTDMAHVQARSRLLKALPIDSGFNAHRRDNEFIVYLINFHSLLNAEEIKLLRTERVTKLLQRRLLPNARGTDGGHYWAAVAIGIADRLDIALRIPADLVLTLPEKGANNLTAFAARGVEVLAATLARKNADGSPI